MQKLKCVLIGCGAIAREHLTTLGEMKNVEVPAVCDLLDARAETTKERFGIARSYSNYEQMLDELKPDLVLIATPPASHFSSIAKECLERGLNVSCEKLTTINYADFVSLKELAATQLRTLWTKRKASSALPYDEFAGSSKANGRLARSPSVTAETCRRCTSRGRCPELTWICFALPILTPWSDDAPYDIAIFESTVLSGSNEANS